MKEEWRTQCAVGRDSTVMVDVDPDAVIGVFAIHLRIQGQKPTGPAWSITHRPTGKAVWHVREYADAIKVAQYLDQERVMPETKEEALEWISKQLPSDRTKFTLALHRIAPRYTGPA